MKGRRTSQCDEGPTSFLFEGTLPVHRKRRSVEDDAFGGFAPEPDPTPSRRKGSDSDSGAPFVSEVGSSSAAGAGRRTLSRSLLLVGVSMLAMAWVEQVADRDRRSLESTTESTSVGEDVGSAGTNAPVQRATARTSELVGTAPVTASASGAARADIAEARAAGDSHEVTMRPRAGAHDPEMPAGAPSVRLTMHSSDRGLRPVDAPPESPLLPAVEAAAHRVELPAGEHAAASTSRTAELEAVRTTLDLYASAYEHLDVDATARVWPTVDRRALARAFAPIRSQGLTFEACEIDLADRSATALCHGNIRFVRKAGSPTPTTMPHDWQFRMRKAAVDWEIEEVTASPASSSESEHQD